MAKKQQSARQKMINLMYLIFIAMMALNISTEVLQGFDLINENLQKAISNAITRNNQLYSELKDSYDSNPEKTREVYEKSIEIKGKTDSLFNYIQSLKTEIAYKTDGEDADVDNLDFKDNIDASSQVMISPLGEGVGKGYDLRDMIDSYRSDIVELINDDEKKTLISRSLATNPSERALSQNQNWVESSFARMPSIAVLSFLTGIQASVKTAEGEALTSLLRDIDFSDFRVNSLEAFVVPQADIVMAGTPYSARIVLAAMDTTQKPKVVVNGYQLPSNIYSTSSASIGTHSFSGHVEFLGRDGVPIRRPFRQEYTVIEPMATVAPLLMDVVYSGIKNGIGISVAGVPKNAIQARVTAGGTLVKDGDNWIATPTGAIGSSFIIEVLVNMGGTTKKVAEKKFRIRALPDPVAYFDYADADGNTKQFKRGAVSRASILNARTLKAAIDDDIILVQFRVISFRTIFMDVMKNALPENSSGANFSQRQLDQIGKLTRGSTFFISSIKVVGPDGVQREVSPIEVRLN